MSVCPRTRNCVGDVLCQLPAIIMPGLELQVTLGQSTGDEPPLAVPAPAGGAAALPPAIHEAVAGNEGASQKTCAAATASS